MWEDHKDTQNNYKEMRNDYKHTQIDLKEIQSEWGAFTVHVHISPLSHNPSLAPPTTNSLQSHFHFRLLMLLTAFVANHHYLAIGSGVLNTTHHLSIHLHPVAAAVC